MRPQDEIRGIARTVIEATGPALQPVAALRRFVVKSRVDVVMSPLFELRNQAANEPGPARDAEPGKPSPPRRSNPNGTSRRRPAT